jgi:hypothetical protein
LVFNMFNRRIFLSRLAACFALLLPGRRFVSEEIDPKPLIISEEIDPRTFIILGRRNGKTVLIRKMLEHELSLR